jgi:two-component system NtrC family sensor kinase
VQTAQRNSLRLLQWMMVARWPFRWRVLRLLRHLLGLDPPNRRPEIERALDVAHEHALKVFETIDRSLSEIAEIVRGVPEPASLAREPALHLRLKQVAARCRR